MIRDSKRLRNISSREYGLFFVAFEYVKITRDREEEGGMCV